MKLNIFMCKNIYGHKHAQAEYNVNCHVQNKCVSETVSVTVASAALVFQRKVCTSSTVETALVLTLVGGSFSMFLSSQVNLELNYGGVICVFPEAAVWDGDGDLPDLYRSEVCGQSDFTGLKTVDCWILQIRSLNNLISRIKNPDSLILLFRRLVSLSLQIRRLLRVWFYQSEECVQSVTYCLAALQPVCIV